MSLKGLIDNQTIIIDDHKRGNGEVKDWDDKSIDVHIDKTTNYPLNGQRQNVRIRIPINTDRDVRIENGRNQRINEIPNQLRKEIRKAFENKNTRERFISDLVNILKDFETVLNSEDRVSQILKRLSQHFDLKWTEEKTATYTNDILVLYTQIYKDELGKEFFITVDNKKIKIGQNNGYARHQKSIRRK